jgi:hypothetical protein
VLSARDLVSLSVQGAIVVHWLQVQELCVEDPVASRHVVQTYFPTIDVSNVQVQGLCSEDPVPLSSRGPGYFPPIDVSGVQVQELCS